MMIQHRAGDETVERQALESWHEAALSSQPGLRWTLEKIGDALCSVCPSEPSILVNRVLGLGSQAKPTLEQLAAIRDLYREAGVPRFFLHVLPQVRTPTVVELLSAAGYRRHRGWMKFARGPEGEAAAAPTSLTVRRIGAEESLDFAEIAANAFDLTPEFVPAVATLAEHSDWRLYMSFDADRAAGTGALYIRGGAGYTDWAATHPDFRRRGSQSAILRRRVDDALAAGCSMISTMTGEAVPGDPQHSYRNILKAGFSEAYLRENWIPADS